MPQRRRVLIVEDSPTQAERLRSLIAADDLDIATFQTAESALDELYRNGADLVLLDLHLPGMNGDEFCREIRLNLNTRAIPVLMLTVEGSDVAQMRGLDSGADDYLAKSADPDVLRVRLRSLLRRSENSGTIIDDDSRLFTRARILAVDDSPSVRYLLQKELEAEHYIVETVASPIEALERVANAEFDCVLVDYEMPGLDGAEVCRRIRKMRHPSEPEVVLIMLTSHEDKEHMTQGFEAGADDYISKGSDLAVTRSRIRALLRRKFLVEENRRIWSELKEKELAALRAQAEREAAELRAQLSDQLAEANRKLDAANKELEQFAFAAAHDLKEPLRMVVNYSQLLQRRYAARLDETANQFLGFSIHAAKRMEGLIEDLLTYARVGGSTGQSESPVDLNSVLDRAIENLHASIQETGAQITRGDLPGVRVEAIRMQQVFQNLIGNGLKYRRSEVAPKIHISAEHKGGEWLFAVADNGVGIAEEYRTMVFEPFRRLGTRSESGTGLGLAICKRTVELNGGTIWVESRPGEGSTFFFTLPSAACIGCVPHGPVSSVI